MRDARVGCFQSQAGDRQLRNDGDDRHDHHALCRGQQTQVLYVRQLHPGRMESRIQYLPRVLAHHMVLQSILERAGDARIFERDERVGCRCSSGLKRIIRFPVLDRTAGFIPAR